MSGPPPTLSAPLIWGAQIPWICAMFTLGYDTATVTPHSVQLARILFFYLKVAPSSAARRLYAVSPQFPQMNLGVYTIALVFSRLASNPILRKIYTITVNTS